MFFESWESRKIEGILYKEVVKNGVECTSKSIMEYQVLQNCGYRLKVLKNGNLSHGSLKKRLPCGYAYSQWRSPNPALPIQQPPWQCHAVVGGGTPTTGEMMKHLALLRRFRCVWLVAEDQPQGKYYWTV